MPSKNDLASIPGGNLSSLSFDLQFQKHDGSVYLEESRGTCNVPSLTPSTHANASNASTLLTPGPARIVGAPSKISIKTTPRHDEGLAIPIRSVAGGEAPVMTRHKYQCKLPPHYRCQRRRRPRRRPPLSTSSDLYERNHRAILHL